MESYLKKYLIPLKNSLELFAIMAHNCADIFEAPLHTSVVDMRENCCFYTDLKVNILNVIQKLQKAEFDRIKDKFIESNLMVDVDKEIAIKKHKRFIKVTEKKLSSDIQSNSTFKLLMLKNELLLNLGFLYFIEELLIILLTDKIERLSPEEPWVRPVNRIS